jgi:hypothetical protein
MCFTHFHIKASSRQCCPRVQTVALCLHAIAIKMTASWRCCPVIRMDAECMHTISLSRISAFGRCCAVVRTSASGLPNPCLQRRAGIFLNSKLHPDVLPWRPDGGNLELFKVFRHWWASEHMTRLSGQKHRIRLLWVGIYTESSLNTWKNFSEISLKTLKYTASLIMTATLHNSDFVNRIQPIKLTTHV